MATHERSAGVLVFRTEPRAHRRDYLLLDYGKYWDFPKGHVEPGELDRAAALRELQEETGIAPDQVQMRDDFQQEIQYFFRAKGRLVRKEVVFFLGQTSAKKITLSHEHVGGESRMTKRSSG